MAVIHGTTAESQNPHGGSVIEVANYHGAAHALRRCALERIGFMDDECFYGAEELESCIRLHDMGYRCLYAPDIVAKHYSILRNRGIELERSLWWTYNHARILFKSFPTDMARLYCQRLLVAQLFYGVKSYEVTAGFRIVRAAREGWASGLRQQCIVGDRTVAYYRNESLRPDFGNVPLSRKIRGRFSRPRQVRD